MWSEYDEIKFATVSEALLPELLPLQQNSHRNQFLMKFRLEFETVRSNLMSRASLPSLDDCLQELLRKQRLVTKTAMEQLRSTEAPLAYVTTTRPPARDISKVQCYNYKKNLVIMPTNAKQRSVGIVKPLVTLLKNIGRKVAILLPATIHRQPRILTKYSPLLVLTQRPLNNMYPLTSVVPPV